MGPMGMDCSKWMLKCSLENGRVYLGTIVLRSEPDFKIIFPYGFQVGYKHYTFCKKN